MQLRRLAACLVFVVLSSAAYADGADVLFSVPPIAKLGVVLWIDSSVLLNNPSDPSALLAAGSVTMLLGVPAAFLLANVINNNPEGVRLWRNVSFFADLGMALLAAGAGIGMIVGDIIQPVGGEDWTPVIGALLISISIPMGFSAWIDTAPFPLEAAAR
jgi:hypothetical protein